MITAVDTNVLIDVLEADPEFGTNSAAALARACQTGTLIACDVVWAEVARGSLWLPACYLSVASIWEVATKFQFGKLPIPPETYRFEMLNAGVAMLPILESHVLALTQNNPIHRDPFDNLLLAVARAEQMKLLTSDLRLLVVGVGMTLNAR